MNNVLKSLETQQEVISVLLNDDNTIMLSIDFKGNSVSEKLFLPKLKFIKFIKSGDMLFVYLDDLSIQKYFSEWINEFLCSLLKADKTINLIEKFNKSLKVLIRVGEKDLKISLNAAKGLYGELFYLKKCLIEAKYDMDSILDAWHRPSLANHDFVFDKYSIEIKCISKNNTTVKIASEYQLDAIENKDLFLQCYIFDDIIQSSVDSLGNIYNEILILLKTNTLKDIFSLKCTTDITGYLGPEYIKLDFNFILIDEMKYKVDQSKFPRIQKNQFSPFINNISYNIDISSIEKFKI
jgi:hypothetical protein